MSSRITPDGPADITVDMVLGGRDLSEPRPSPDGTLVAFGVRHAGRSMIVTVPLAGAGPERIVTTQPEPAVGRGTYGGCFDWFADSAAIVYAGRDGQLWRQPMPGGVPTPIASAGEGRSVDAPVVAGDGSFVVAVVDHAEIWRWWLADDRPPERLDDGSADFVFDPYVTSCLTGVLWQAWDVPAMPWDAARVQRVVLDGLARDEFRPNGAIQQIATLPDGRGAGVRDDTGWLNVWIDDAPLVDEPFEHAAPTWGPRQRSYAVSPDAARVAFTRNERGFGRLCVTDIGGGQVSDIGRGVHAQLSWVPGSLVALRSGARTPTQVVAYDTETWQRRVLAVGPVSAWDHIDLPEPEAMTVDVEGVAVHARRYVAGNGRMLCWIHGGPTDQWRVEFLPRLAYWWAKGWDVLVPDPRGSTGHGRAYQQALRGAWGRRDVGDVAAVIDAAHAAGWSDPRHTVVLGSSAGGLTALGVVGLHPGRAAGAVAVSPVTDPAALATAPDRFEAHYTLGLVGPLDDVQRYREHSAHAYADQIDVPVLIMHGDADPIVPIASTYEFVDRMRAAGGDVELHVFAGEGHGFADPNVRRADFELTEAFLARVAQ